jgi:hypothetical protein
MAKNVPISTIAMVWVEEPVQHVRISRAVAVGRKKRR